MQRESMNNYRRKNWTSFNSVRAYKRTSDEQQHRGSVKFYMEVIEEVIVERKKFKKLRMKKRKRARKFELKQEI